MSSEARAGMRIRRRPQHVPVFTKLELAGTSVLLEQKLFNVLRIMHLRTAKMILYEIFLFDPWIFTATATIQSLSFE